MGGKLSSSSEDLLANYNNVLKEILDKHAPQMERKVVLRLQSPWYNTDLEAAKRLKRKLERKWLKSKLTVDLQIYRDQCAKLNKLLLYHKKDYFSNKVVECGSDQRALHKLAKKQMGKGLSPILPSDSTDAVVASKFSMFFLIKWRRLTANSCNLEFIMMVSILPVVLRFSVNSMLSHLTMS